MWMLQTPQWGLSVPVAWAGVTDLCVRKVTLQEKKLHRELLKYIYVCLIWPEVEMSSFSFLDLLPHSEDRYYKVGVFHLRK